MPKSMARNIDIPMYNSLELLLMCLKLMMMIAHHDVCPNLNENDYSLDVDYHFLALSFSNQQLVVHDFHRVDSCMASSLLLPKF